MNKIILITISFLIGYSAFSQQEMIVYFKDKNSSTTLMQHFSERSMQRRAINHVEFDEFDKLVSNEYLSEIQNFGTIKNISRWLNAVTLTTFHSEQEIIQNCPFVSKIKVISQTSSKIEKPLDLNAKAIDYGVAVTQAEQLNLACLHDNGFTGNGVYLAVIDAGFNNMDNINYFDSVYNSNRVVDVYNFIDNSENIYGLSQHGTAVASCIVGYKAAPFEYAGTGVGVDLALYVTEDVSSETELEEFNLVTALERCDSVGVNIANISLGYVDFDDPSENHSYEDMNGSTTIAAIGVNVAFSKGILVVAAAGNSGPSYLSTPCDADDGLCVGAVDANGFYANFSSVGPASDGAIKPNVSAMGRDSWVVDENGDVIQSSGTSFASPIIAGAAACLLQAHPTNTVQEIKSAIEQSAHQFDSPDEFLGYGIPDFCDANSILESLSLDELTHQNEIQLFQNPANDFISVKVTNKQEIENVDFTFTNLLGQNVELDVIEKNAKTITFNVSSLLNGVYFLNIELSESIITKEIVIAH